MFSSLLQRFDLISRAALVACALGTAQLFAPGQALAICEAPVTCICEEWPTDHVVRGQVRDNTGALSQVEVMEVLAGAGADAVSPGDLIEGELAEPSTCGLSLSSFTPGDEVLALWQGKRCAYDASDECADAMPRLVLLPWGSELDLGDGRMLASDSAAVLADRNQCNFMFAPPPPPCDDQILVEVDDDGRCSVGSPGSSPASHRDGSLGIASIGLALALLLARMRRVPK
jgi:hypothetical protein